MTTQNEFNYMVNALQTIAKNGGQAEDFIYTSDGENLHDDNYDIALTVLGFDGTHKETDFDKALETFFQTIKNEMTTQKETTKMTTQTKKIVSTHTLNIEDGVKRALDLVNLFYNPYAKHTNEEQYTKMERLAKRMERETSLGLASAFMSGSYYGHDSFAMIANSKAYELETGYVVFNKYTNKAEFIKGE